MTEFWEAAFTKMQMAWGLEPTVSARLAAERFAKAGAKDVLIPGIGYGRNAKAFLDKGMSVTGIEISETAIALARERLGLDIPIVHGSVTDMPFGGDAQYDGIFCYGLLYLLDAPGRAKMIRDSYNQLRQGGQMIFTLISKKAPMYGQGPKLGRLVRTRARPADVFLRCGVRHERARRLRPHRAIGDRRAATRRLVIPIHLRSV